jgi:hypothetical protein
MVRVVVLRNTYRLAAEKMAWRGLAASLGTFPRTHAFLLSTGFKVAMFVRYLFPG